MTNIIKIHHPKFDSYQPLRQLVISQHPMRGLMVTSEVLLCFDVPP